MKKLTLLCACIFISLRMLSGQENTITGALFDEQQNAVEFANVVLYDQQDSSIVKVEATNENGQFSIRNIRDGAFYLEASSLGYETTRYTDIQLRNGSVLKLGTLTITMASIELETAVLTASRALVEIKPDRTVFNVQGTINSTGDDGLNLLRKAPGVLVDNNNNITVLGRSGVLVYVDGKRLPLSGDDLTNYLQSLPAEQIDRIDIVSNPGARYEAEGNAGIIDIRLKKDENLGANGTVSSTLSQGRYLRGNMNGTGNYRNKFMNVFGTLGYNAGDRFTEMKFLNFQNGLVLDEYNFIRPYSENWNFRLGTDFFVSPKSTIGFLVTGNYGQNETASSNRAFISTGIDAPVDSVLIANNASDRENDQNTFNLNYVYTSGETRLNIDADYGRYRNDFSYFQPNRYFDASLSNPLTEVITAYDTPVEIDIYAFTLDYERALFGGKLGTGTKLSRVRTDNTFLFYDIPDGDRILNDRRSNLFLYDEYVYAGYVNYSRKIDEKWNFSAGLRLEQTDATGDLQAFLPELQEPPIELNYLNVFPSFGLTYQPAREHTFAFNYGRRINRPDYNVLNPFRIQLSELSFSRGNPFLQPEIVNNYEVNYTLKYRYNFKVSYSKTLDQITRLIGPDENDPRAGFITWANLAVQHVYAANISAPVEITGWWNAFFNANASYIDNQADYGEGGVVDVQAFSYNIYQQHTFKLPGGFTGEISGWYSGPGVWGGVFEYDPSWSLNFGLQRKFMRDQMNVRLTVNDVFYETPWSGVSRFNGLEAEGRGNWDSRRVSLSVSMQFGNRKVKSRKRKTGIEAEAGRISE